MNDTYADTKEACRILNHMAESRKEECEKLRAELANYKWISVKDRMPEPNTEVLIFIPDGEKGVICTDEICHGDWLVFTRENVTHWMPLPEPPKE